MATRIPFQYLESLSYPVLLTYVAVLQEKARAQS